VHVAAVINSAACLMRWIPSGISLQSLARCPLISDVKHSKLRQRLECGMWITVEPALLR